MLKNISASRVIKHMSSCVEQDQGMGQSDGYRVYMMYHQEFKLCITCSAILSVLQIADTIRACLCDV